MHRRCATGCLPRSLNTCFQRTCVVSQVGLMMGGDVFYGTRKDFVIE